MASPDWLDATVMVATEAEAGVSGDVGGVNGIRQLCPELQWKCGLWKKIQLIVW